MAISPNQMDTITDAEKAEVRALEELIDRALLAEKSSYSGNRVSISGIARPGQMIERELKRIYLNAGWASFGWICNCREGTWLELTRTQYCGYRD